MASDKTPNIVTATELSKETKSRDILKCCMSLDSALGGGIPLGATVLIGGKFKSGKTTLALQYSAYAQKNFGCKVFYFPIEGRLTSKVLEQIQGLDLNNLHIVRPPALLDDEENIIGYEKWSAESWWEQLGQMVATEKNSVMIVDSIANMATEKEFSEDMGYQSRGGQQKAESQFCRKFGDMVIPNKITMFLLTQGQANTGGYGESFLMKVGNHIQHQSDVIIMCKGVEKWPDKDGKILGHNILSVIKESALGAPYMEAKVPLRYGFGIDTYNDIITHATTWGLIQQKGSWFSLPFTEKKKEGKETTVFEWNTEFPTGKDKDVEGRVKAQGEHSIRNWLLLNTKESKMLEKELNKRVFGE